MRHATQQTTFKFTILAVSIAAGLTACGGGGTTGGLIAPDPGTPTAYTNPNRVEWTLDNTSAAAADVKVGVVDTGFKADHFEIADSVVNTKDVANSGSLTNSSSTHGTSVAQVLAGDHVGYSGNVDLYLAKVADATGTAYSDKTYEGMRWAMAQGAKVVNISLDNLFRTDVTGSSITYDVAAGNDAVLVMGAGNANANITAANGAYTDVFEDATRRAQILVVGALTPNLGGGDSKASYSNYAGEDVNVQNRFLSANGAQKVQDYNGTTAAVEADLTTVNGTSFAAPQVAAAAATVMAYWPHMGGADTAQLLLDTADRSFTNLYSQNNCGTGGTTNCGLYYFGQGKLDVAAAMSPVGLPTLPIGVSVSGPSVKVSATSLSLPTAFGDAATNATVNAAMFDSYGRDFKFNAMGLVGKARPASFAANMLGETSERVSETEQGSAFSSVSFAPNGAIKSMRMGFDGGTYATNFAHGSGSALDQHDSPMPMASLVGSGNLGAFSTADSLGFAYKAGKGAKVEGRVTLASSPASSGYSQGASATRNEVGMTFEPANGTSVSVGYALTNESGSMLGSTGQGALGLNGSVQQAATFKLRQNLGNGWTAFGQAEVGTMNVSGSGMMTSLSGARTTQFGAGFAWAGKDSKFGLSVSQPVRVGNATATFDVPVGRDLAGNVIREQQSLSLSPSGRQINYEMAYQKQLTPLSAFSLNAVYARDYGHVQGENEASVMFFYRMAW